MLFFDHFNELIEKPIGHARLCPSGPVELDAAGRCANQRRNIFPIKDRVRCTINESEGDIRALAFLFLYPSLPVAE